MARLRLSLKRCFVYLLCLTGGILVLVNVRQKELWRAAAPGSGQPRPEQLTAVTRPGSDVAIRALPQTARSVVVPTRKALTRGRAKMKKLQIELIAAWRKAQLQWISNVTGITNAGIDITDPARRPWYMKGGKMKPRPAPVSRRTGRRLSRLWPEEDSKSDRVTNQLMFMPPGYNESNTNVNYKIYIPHGMSEAKIGQGIFKKQGCPVQSCAITDNPHEADLVLFKDYVTHIKKRKPKQVWMLYFLECPFHTQSIKNALVNWTATYRRDSDIVAPYERWQYYNPSITQIPQTFNYAANKTKKVAWFVSNCHARNERMQYAKELSKHIEVDIYGACGTLKCPRSQMQACFDMLDNDYKFYLAFENSNCRDYITEKFFVNGLQHNVLPIVMGAHQSDYERSAPYRSYIHVDEFESPKELAQFLHRLDQDDDLYNSYFRWKGTGEFINTYFWCRVCSMLHDQQRRPKFYKDVNAWWRGHGVCVEKSWRELEQLRDM